MSFERARAIADAVLFEGYVLYPYRASSMKNRYRWTFGVAAPKAWSEGPRGSDPWWLQTECLVEPGEATCVDGVLRFMQAQRRVVEAPDRDGYREVASLPHGDGVVVPWDEGVIHEVPLGPFDPGALVESLCVPFFIPGSRSEESIGTTGRIVRCAHPLRGTVVCSAVRDGTTLRLRVRVQNDTVCPDPSVSREEALRRGLLSTHLLLRVSGGAFQSVTDPPEDAAGAARRCENVHLYPVLAGGPGERDLLLSAPIILSDHPEVARESIGETFDSAEIDELLTLCTTTLSDEEKRLARATDPRAARLIDRVDHLPPEMMERLHGAVRELSVLDEHEASSASFAPGGRVRLRPGVRRTDAQDCLFTGRMATIRRVLEDVEGRTWLAVTLDDDPGAELNDWYGRYHYYYPDEVDHLDGGDT